MSARRGGWRIPCAGAAQGQLLLHERRARGAEGGQGRRKRRSRGCPSFLLIRRPCSLYCVIVSAIGKVSEAFSLLILHRLLMILQLNSRIDFPKPQQLGVQHFVGGHATCGHRTAPTRGRRGGGCRSGMLRTRRGITTAGCRGGNEGDNLLLLLRLLLLLLLVLLLLLMKMYWDALADVMLKAVEVLLSLLNPAIKMGTEPPVRDWRYQFNVSLIVPLFALPCPVPLVLLPLAVFAACVCERCLLFFAQLLETSPGIGQRGRGRATIGAAADSAVVAPRVEKGTVVLLHVEVGRRGGGVIVGEVVMLCGAGRRDHRGEDAQQAVVDGVARFLQLGTGKL